MIDTHCHLDLAAKKLPIQQLIDEAHECGVTKIVVPAINDSNWSIVNDLGNQHPSVYFALGIHPGFINGESTVILANLSDYMEQTKSNKKWVAVGECGLDFFHGRENEAQQKQVLIAQLQLANRFKIPVLLHSRKAHQDLIKILKQWRPEFGGVIHGFSGSYQQAMDYINLGIHIGVGGVISYERAQKTKATIAKIPLESIVVETDSPDMPLSGYQGKINQPKMIKLVLKSLIELRSEDEQTVTYAVHNNSFGLFSFCE